MPSSMGAPEPCSRSLPLETFSFFPSQSKQGLLNQCNTWSQPTEQRWMLLQLCLPRPQAGVQQLLLQVNTYYLLQSPMEVISA